MKLICDLDEERLQDLMNLSTGVFYPLNGFMTSRYDCEVLASDAGREAIALAHVDVMLDWVGVRVPPMTPLPRSRTKWQLN